MQPNKNHVNTSDELDRGFRGGEYVDALFSKNDSNTRARWYARMLTALTITAGGEDIVWAQMQLREDEGEVLFTVLTARAVILGHATAVYLDDPKVDVRAIGRSALAELEVHADMEIDREGSSAHAWPGNVSIAALYYVPEKRPVVFVAKAKTSDGVTEAPVLRLLAELQKDLNS